MKLTEKEVRYVADLANLKLNDGEIESMVRHLGAILDHMDRLGEIDTADVEPMRQVLFPASETARCGPTSRGPASPTRKPWPTR